MGFGYYSYLKTIQITTSMSVISEQYFVNDDSGLQNTNYINVLTDFLPDLSVQGNCGASVQNFIFNASSLYRIFQFNQQHPLTQITLNINILDKYNNLYPLQLDKGQVANFKIMFIKKSVYSGMSKMLK
jgi:hypothetical protein